ncbi:MAG: hypothetical protein JST86_10855 [Bacteroidetes bacterium]|nr:hypothetical protein [Bacteroidota bacterium]
MKKLLILPVLIIVFATVHAQTTTPADSAARGTITVNKDPRMDLLAKQEADINKATVGLGTKAAKGYRLLVANSNDRNYVMNLRTALLRRYPEQKVYLTFQSPFFKLKFGDFTEKDDAEKYRKAIAAAKLATTNIYLIPEIVEVKADKNKETDDN